MCIAFQVGIYTLIMLFVTIVQYTNAHHYNTEEGLYIYCIDLCSLCPVPVCHTAVVL